MSPPIVAHVEAQLALLVVEGLLQDRDVGHFVFQHGISKPVGLVLEEVEVKAGCG